MKNAMFGFFTCHKYTMKEAYDSDVYGDPKTSSVIFAEESAIADYKKNRLNGELQDYPKRAFPQDGKYAWAYTGTGESATVKYHPGPNDQAWMKECDRNYITRTGGRPNNWLSSSGCSMFAATTAVAIVGIAVAVMSKAYTP